MVEISFEILEIIKRYLKELETNGFFVSEAYLYGSYAFGTADKWSDIDLGIESEQFEGNRFLDNMKILGINRKVDLRISPYPFIKSDIEDNPFVLYEIIKKGIKVG
jgi:predicted nucleotidyltransferase